jgi:hypothetical protein
MHDLIDSLTDKRKSKKRRSSTRASANQARRAYEVPKAFKHILS